LVSQHNVVMIKMGRFERFVKGKFWRWLLPPSFIAVVVVLTSTPLTIYTYLGGCVLIGCLLGLIYRKLGLLAMFGSLAIAFLYFNYRWPFLVAQTIAYAGLALIFLWPFILAFLLALIAMIREEKNKTEENR